MRKRILPMKFKFLFVLLTLPTLGGVSYYFTATKLFKEDKVAYVFSHAQQEALKVDRSFQKLSSDLENIFITFIDENAYPDGYMKFLTHKYSILELRLYKNQKEIFSYGNPKQEVFQPPTKGDVKVSVDSKKEGVFFFEFRKKHKDDDYFIKYVLQYPEFFNLINEMESFSALMFMKGGEILISNTKEFGADAIVAYQNEVDRIQKQKIKAITVSKAFKKSEYLSSLLTLKLGKQNYYLLLLQDHVQAFSAINVFKVKSFLILTIIIALAAIAAILFAHHLTYNLKILKDAAEKLSKENFDQQVYVGSNDELGLLAQTFDTMRVNIKGLMEKIREYNLFLEDKVAERTAELNQALQLQKAMVDNLDQGFLMFKNDGVILPVYSKATLQMFSKFKKSKTLGEALASDDEEAQSISQYFGLMCSGELPFEDVTALAPASFINEKKQIIHFNYTPVMNESQKVDYVVVVATDKTGEIQAKEEVKRQKDHAEAIINFVTDKKQFIALLENYKHQKRAFLSNPAPQAEEFKIYIHTLKGNAGIYHLGELADYLHQREDLLEQQNTVNPEELKTVFAKIDFLLNQELEKYGVMLGFENLEDLAKTKEVKTTDIQKIYQLALKENHLELTQSIEEALVYEPIEKLLPRFDQEISRLASKLGKEVEPIQIKNADIKAPGTWEDLFINLSHLVRNSIDHGIEYPEERIRSGKSSAGKIQIFFKKTEKYLHVTFMDNGRGISLQRLREMKGLDLNLPEEELLSVVFEKGFSIAANVTEISGRGVGLSALKQAVIKLNGSIEIRTQETRGSTFYIKIPWENNPISSQAA